MKINMGFTLIELIIAVAIICILAAISINLYQSYMIKSRINSAFYEISEGIASYEINANHNYLTITTAEDISLQSSTHFCMISITAPDALGVANKAISCKLKNKNGLGNLAEIYFSRNTNGHFSCESIDIPNKFLPTSFI